MPENTFNRARFESRLSTRHFGRHLVIRDTVESTNDDAWDALAHHIFAKSGPLLHDTVSKRLAGLVTT